MKNLIVVLIIFNLTSCFGQNIKGNHTNSHNRELIQLVLNNQNDLHTRINAIKDLDLSEEKSTLLKNLKSILSRQKPAPESATMDWDPSAEERVVDLYIIETLNKLKDTSENNKIPVLVSQAIPFMREFGDERKEDAKVIKSIHDKNVYAEIVGLTNNKNSNVIENAVIVLNNLNFPNSPIGGDLNNILPNTIFKFQFSHLKDEMDLYVKKSEGKIRLSNGVNQYISNNNTQLANDNEFIIIESTLSNAIEKNTNNVFNYYIESNQVIICTYQEAAKKWQDWWSINENKIK